MGKKEPLEFLRSGDKARLIPTLADTSKENRATSVFLACLSAIHELGKVMLASVGLRVGTSARIDCFTEVCLTQDFERRDRPDGLIVVTIGKRRWCALVEAKIGSALLNDEQLEKYIALAKANKIDAVITISNQFAALPTHHPIKIAKSKQRGIEIYHWSWMFVLTQAVLVLQSKDEIDQDQRYVLGEMVRYFRHDSSGVKTFDRMNVGWKDVVQKVKSGANLAKTSEDVEGAVGCWHQEERDLCLILSRRLATNVSIRLSRVHRTDPEKRLRDDCETLAQEKKLRVSFDIPDAAAPMEVTANLATRTISCSMRLEAPKDKKGLKARVNWALRQLARVTSNEVFITARYPGSAASTQEMLEEIRENQMVLAPDNPSLVPNWFEISMIRDIAGRFSGSKTFVEQIEALVPDFYEQIGEHLRAWVPPPPKFQPPQVPTGAENQSDKDRNTHKPSGERA